MKITVHALAALGHLLATAHKAHLITLTFNGHDFAWLLYALLVPLSLAELVWTIQAAIQAARQAKQQ